MKSTEDKNRKKIEKLENKKEILGEKLDNVNSQIKELAEKSGKKMKKSTQSFWADFKKFVAKGNIIDLAVAVVVGAAFNKVVNALVANIITPLTALLLPSGDFAALKWVLKPAVEADEALGIEAVEEVAVTYGVFIEALVDFLIVSLTLFVIIRTFLRLKNRINAKELEAEKAKKAEEERKKKEEEERKAELQRQVEQKFIDDVAAQADELKEIKEIMLRMEQQGRK